MGDDGGVPELFIPMAGTRSAYRLNPDAVLNEVYHRNSLPHLEDENTRNVDNPLHVLNVKSPNYYVERSRVVATTFATVVVGVLFQYSSPSQHRFASREGRNLANSTGRFPGATSVSRTVAGFNKIGFFGDVSPNSAATFCMFFKNKHSLQELAGFDMEAQKICLGDAIAIVRPNLHDAVLHGTGTPILKDAVSILVLKKRLSYPQRPIKMGDGENTTTFFHQTGVTVSIARPIFLSGKGSVPCFTTTCDRQDPNCKGCMHAVFRKNIVLSVTVEVDNQPQYNPHTGVASFQFRSYNFMKQFIKDMDYMLNAEIGTINSHLSRLEFILARHARFVNTHGGWTVDGWHRRGSLMDQATGQPTLSSETEGHLIKLVPTNISAEDEDECSQTLFSFIM